MGCDVIPSLKKRFWTNVCVVELQGTWGVELDGHRVKTPAKVDLAVPLLPIAKLIAQEWEATSGEVDPAQMPATRWANAAIDKVASQRDGVVDMLAEYGGTDLLCYRADSPRTLSERQQAAWNPVLEWAEIHLSAPLKTTFGMMPVAQSGDSLAALKSELQRLSTFELAAVHDLVTISGSLVLALAVFHQEISALRAWEHGTIDEVWQVELWGEDEAAEIAALARKQSFLFAADLLILLRAEDPI